MAITAEILTHLQADASQFKAEMASAQASTEASASGFDKFAAVGKVAFLGIAGAAAAVAVIGVKAALDYEEAHARLTSAIAASGSTWAAQQNAVEKTDASLRQLGFTDTDTEGAMSKLVRATKSTEDATRLMGLAADIARGRHIDLATATDILVKVESGRVGLLGRLGISTTDATGKTISQAEALKRLSDLYGGAASTYADTFAGKLKVVEANLDHIAVAIGEAVIPVITTLTGALSDVINFLQQNSEVAIALAVVIGGPLVAAMLAWAASLAITGFNAIITFFADAAVGATVLAGEMYQLAVATLTADAAFETASMTAGAFLVALALPIAAAVGLGYVLDKLTGGGGSFGALVDRLDQAGDAGTKLGKSLADQADKLAFLRPPIETLRSDLADLRVKQDSIVESWHEGILSQDDAMAAYKKTGAAIDEVKKAIAAQKQEMAAAKDVAVQTAKQYGIEMPDRLTMSAQAWKNLQKAMSDAETKFGDVGQSAIQALVKIDSSGTILASATKNFDTLMQSISSFTDVATAKITYFGIEGYGSMENFFVQTNQAAQDWTVELQALISRGVDEGIIAQFARAGPQSKPQLDAFTAMVDAHGVAWVNSIDSATRKAALLAAINMAEMSAVAGAIVEAFTTGNATKLQNMANSSDTNFRNMARTAIEQTGGITNGINSIPPTHDTKITVTHDGLHAVDAVWAALNALQDKQVTIHVTSVFDQIVSDRNLKENVVPVA